MMTETGLRSISSNAAPQEAKLPCRYSQDGTVILGGMGSVRVILVYTESHHIVLKRSRRLRLHVKLVKA